MLPSFIRSSIRAEGEGGGGAPSAREAVDGLSTAVGGNPVARWGATPYHCLNQPLENICRDSELEESNNYFKGLVSEVGLL